MDITMHRRDVWNVICAVLFIVALTIFCQIAGYSLIIPLLLLFLGIHLYYTRKADLKIFLDMGLLMALLLFVTHVLQQYSSFPMFYIPVASVGMLTMLLFNDLNLSFIMSFLSSILVSLVLKVDFGIMLTFFMGSLTGAYAVRESRTRGQLINAGLFVSAIHIVCLFLLNSSPSVFLVKEFALSQVYPLVANGFISAFFVVASLKIFEYLFSVLTNYSLLELSDFNQPLLKRMILEAPGSYHHSLLVSNLSEAAADAIGANALLARVGAYYHDIGKMVKPEYFTENQVMGVNKHDHIEPSMSRLVILKHVKEGIELAKKNKLNPKIIDFIPQHHGTSLMYYFYQKSLEAAEEGEEIEEADFRYPGPKPQNRETAITLLADSVEGATRALDEPNPIRIEETVKKIINNKFIDGQLDECNLTLKEINKISETFTRILGAMYHGRIKYPEPVNKSKNATVGKIRSQSRNGSNNRKSAEKGFTQSPSDQKDRPDSASA